MKLFATRRAARAEDRAADAKCRLCRTRDASPDELACPVCRDDQIPTPRAGKHRNRGTR